MSSNRSWRLWERHRVVDDEGRVARLQRLLPFWPSEPADVSPEGRARVVARLHQALRAERRRGIAGHWTYDLARHRDLLAAYRQEIALLPRPARRG
jgi:hypothetical protein